VPELLVLGIYRDKGSGVCGGGVAELDLIWLSTALTVQKNNTRARIVPTSRNRSPGLS
jgi:hypothetical protein